MNQMLSLIVLIGFISCTGQPELPPDVPVCIEQKIVDIKRDDVWNPPARVYRVRYKGELAYYFTSRCCDIPSELYDEKCELICNPDGGFSGMGDGRCTDFNSELSDEELVWEDDRK